MVKHHLKFKKQQTKTKQPKKKKSAMSNLLDGMILLSASGSILLFSNRLNQHLTTIKLYAPTAGPYYFIYEHGSKYLHNVLLWLAHIFKTPSAVGIAVILLTILVRIITFTGTALAQKLNVTASQRRLKLKPQLDLAQQYLLYHPLKQKSSLALRNLQTDCIKRNHAQAPRIFAYVNMIISIVIFTALYQSIAYSTKIDRAYFLGINLMQRSIPLTLISSVLYAVGYTYRWSLFTPAEKAANSAISYFIVPFTTFMSGYFLPGIISLYWTTSASCLIVQYVAMHYLVEPWIIKQENERFEPLIMITKTKINTLLTQNA